MVDLGKPDGVLGAATKTGARRGAPLCVSVEFAVDGEVT